MGREVDVYDFPPCNIDDRDKILYKNQGYAPGDRSRFIKYQRMRIKVFVFRIASKAECLLDSRGKREPLLVANCPAIRGNLVGLDAYGTLNSRKRFSTEGSLSLTNFLCQPLNLRVFFYNFFTFQQFFWRNLGLGTGGKLFDRLYGPSPPS